MQALIPWLTPLNAFPVIHLLLQMSSTGVFWNPSYVVKYSGQPSTRATPASPLVFILLTFCFKQWYWQPLKKIEHTSTVKENMQQNLCNHIAKLSGGGETHFTWKGNQCCSYSQALICPEMLTSKQTAQHTGTSCMYPVVWYIPMYVPKNFMQSHRKARQLLPSLRCNLFFP